MTPPNFSLANLLQCIDTVEWVERPISVDWSDAVTYADLPISLSVLRV